MAGDLVRWTVKWDHSREASDVLRRRIGIEVYNSAVRIEGGASERAPVETGELSESGEIEEHDETHYAVIFGRNLPDGRAIYQEYGTSRMPAQPYIAPSVQEDVPILLNRLAMTTQGRIRHDNVITGQAFEAANPLRRFAQEE